jgi:5'-3' exonuclease
MGVKGLYTYLKHYRNDIDPRDSNERLRIGVDAMSLLYRYKGNTQGILELLTGLLKAGHVLFFVFDGKPPAEKEREVQARKDAKMEAGAKANSIESFLQSDAAKEMEEPARQLLEVSLQRCQNQSWHMTRELRHTFQQELWNLEIPYVKSISEADDVLVDLFAARKLDVILSSDMDYLLSGIGRLWIPTHKGIFHFEEIVLAEVLVGEGMSLGGFMDAGLLCGTEEREGSQGVPCLTAFTWMRHYGSLEALLHSTVTDRVMRSMFPNMAAVQEGRASLVPKEPYSRIRPDHLERVMPFLEALEPIPSS